MQIAEPSVIADDSRLLLVVWKTLVGLVAVAGLVYVGTLLVESVLPELPDQARAGIAARHTALAVPNAALAGPQSVEHFHTQFRLTPGSDGQAHVENF